MKKFKDFSHNISDILLAVVIVLIAAGIIFWRLKVILDYPEQAARENIQTTQTEELQDDATDSGDAEDAAVSEDAEDATDSEDAGNADDEAEYYGEEQTDTSEEAQG